MRLPVLLAVDDDRDALDDVETQLARRYAHDYRIESLGDPHEAISSFLLEWARDRCVVPQPVHVVGESWSGRAYELREALGQCAAPHIFCLAESETGRDLLSRAGPDAKLPLMVLPDGLSVS